MSHFTHVSAEIRDLATKHLIIWGLPCKAMEAVGIILEQK